MWFRKKKHWGVYFQLNPTPPDPHFSMGSREIFDGAREKVERQLILRSEAKANSSSKSSSMVLEVCAVTLGISLPRALMVDKPSSLPSPAGEAEGGCTVNTEDPKDVE